MLNLHGRIIIITAMVCVVELLPSTGSFAAAQKISPGECARLKSRVECESCMRRLYGSTSRGSKGAAGNKSIQWGGACGAGI